MGLSRAYGYYREVTEPASGWSLASSNNRGTYLQVSGGVVEMEYKSAPITRNSAEKVYCGGSSVCDALSNYFVVRDSEGRFIGPDNASGQRIYTTWIGSIVASPDPVMARADGGNYWISITAKDNTGKGVPDGTILVFDQPPYYGHIYNEAGNGSSWIYASTAGGTAQIRYVSIMGPNSCWPYVQLGTTIWVDDSIYAETWSDGKITVTYRVPNGPDC